MSRPAAGRKILLSIAILLVMAVAAGGGGFVLLRSRPGEDVLASRAAPGGAGGTAATAGGIRIPGEGGGPLFRFGNPYLDGRSGWLAARFLEARARARDCPLPDAPVVSAGVHRAPFSGGPWLESLPADIARQRTETEGQAVESSVTFFVPGGEPRALIRYLAFSNFVGRIPGEGTIEKDLYFPPLDRPPGGLRAVPDLARNEWLSRERWSRPMAYPTDTFYVHSVFLEGDAAVEVLEAWENVPGEGKAPIRLCSTQYVVVPRPGGALVSMSSFYSGQTIPPLLDGLVESMTSGFWKKVADLVRREGMGWTPPPDLAARLEGMGI